MSSGGASELEFPSRRLLLPSHSPPSHSPPFPQPHPTAFARNQGSQALTSWEELSGGGVSQDRSPHATHSSLAFGFRRVGGGFLPPSSSQSARRSSNAPCTLKAQNNPTLQAFDFGGRSLWLEGGGDVSAKGVSGHLSHGPRVTLGSPPSPVGRHTGRPWLGGEPGVPGALCPGLCSAPWQEGALPPEPLQSPHWAPGAASGRRADFSDHAGE